MAATSREGADGRTYYDIQVSTDERMGGVGYRQRQGGGRRAGVLRHPGGRQRWWWGVGCTGGVVGSRQQQAGSTRAHVHVDTWRSCVLQQRRGPGAVRQPAAGSDCVRAACGEGRQQGGGGMLKQGAQEAVSGQAAAGGCHTYCVFDCNHPAYHPATLPDQGLSPCPAPPSSPLHRSGWRPMPPATPTPPPRPLSCPNLVWSGTASC